MFKDFQDGRLQSLRELPMKLEGKGSINRGLLKSYLLEMVGALMYLSAATRPDICAAVNLSHV
jgi:hypothetical protein